MSVPQKVVVVKRESYATLRHEVVSRESLIDLRRALLHSLKAVEKQLGIEQRCPHCAYVLSK